jgi:hypothetical protein
MIHFFNPVMHTMYRFLSFSAMVALSFLMAACGGNNSAESDSAAAIPTAPVEAAPVQMEYGQAFDTAQHDKKVILEGYLQLPNMMYTSGNEAQVDFHARPYQRYGLNITANITTGDCKNCMKALGERYELSDLKMQADDGSEVLANQRVRLSGRLRVHTSTLSANGLSASLDVTKIEKATEAPIDYSKLEVVKLTKENLMDTTLKDALTSHEGKITIPTMLFMENDVTLDMQVGGERIGVNLLFGQGPNQIEPIPSNYSNSDFKIHDHQGNIIKLNKPVKVWGTRSTPRKDSPGILYVEHIEQ